jgi:hypothetical protein
MYNIMYILTKKVYKEVLISVVWYPSALLGLKLDGAVNCQDRTGHYLNHNYSIKQSRLPLSLPMFA